MAVEVKFRHEKDLGAYVFTFHFKKHEFQAVQAMTGLIRATVPASHREYNPNSHEWTLLDAYWDNFHAVLKQGNFKLTEDKTVAPEDFFYQNQGVASATIVDKNTLANQLLALLGITAEELADANKAKKAYRRTALLLHPDRNGGDGSRMSELNSVWSSYNATSTSN
jgi:hypothetical protein